MSPARLPVPGSVERSNLMATLANSIVLAHADPQGILQAQTQAWLATSRPVQMLDRSTDQGSVLPSCDVGYLFAPAHGEERSTTPAMICMGTANTGLATHARIWWGLARTPGNRMIGSKQGDGTIASAISHQPVQAMP